MKKICLINAIDDDYKALESAEAILSETPAQSLAQHDVVVIDKAINAFRENDHIHNDNGYEYIYIQTLTEYADNISKGAK